MTYLPGNSGCGDSQDMKICRLEDLQAKFGNIIGFYVEVSLKSIGSPSVFICVPASEIFAARGGIDKDSWLICLHIFPLSEPC